MKLVKVTGHFDFMQEFRVDTKKNNDRGFNIVNPLYTHLDKDGNSCGILVNRGFVS